MVLKRNYKRKPKARANMRRRPYKGRRARGLKGPTELTFRLGKQIHQPLPDRFFTWLTLNQSGYVTGAATPLSCFEFGLNSVCYPFNFNINALPNPIIALGACAFTGLNNILYNSVTGTGLYENFRVWRAKVAVTWLPQALGDTSQAVMVPLVPTASVGGGIIVNTYGGTSAGIMQAGQSPRVINKPIQSGAPVKTNTLYGNYSIPELMGMPSDKFAADQSSFGQYGTGAPSTGGGPSTTISLYSAIRSLDQANFGQPVGIEVRLEYFVEFFRRTDKRLLIS